MALSADLPTELLEQHRRIAPTVLAAEQILPIPEIFHSIVPGGGLQRGWTTRVEGDSSARAFAWAMLSEVTTAGGWIATVDVSGISLEAAREVGVAIERVLIVTSPDRSSWSATIGALIGAVDVIVFGAPRHRVQPREYRRMASRCRERGTVLVELASANEGQLQYDVTFDVEPIAWRGLGQGFGRLQSRDLDVSATGRRMRGGTRHGRFEIPAADGTLKVIDSGHGGHRVHHTEIHHTDIAVMDLHRRGRTG